MKAAQERLSDSELLNIFSLSQNATAIYTTENIIIQAATDSMIAFWGKDRSVIGKPLEEAVPELKGQPFIGILQQVWRTGTTYQTKEAQAELLVDGRLQTFYFDFMYRAVKNNDGSMYCILHTATDVTEIVQSKSLLKKTREHEEALVREQSLNEELATSMEELRSVNDELSISQERLTSLNDDLEKRVENRTRQVLRNEARFRSLVEQLPVATNVFISDELIVDLPNPRMLEIWGRTYNEVANKPLDVGMPELKDQPFMQKLRDVITTGIPYSSNAEKASIMRNGKLEELYFDIVYQPIRNEDGTITSCLQVATDVTEAVLSQQKIQALNENLAALNEEQAATNEELLQTQNNLLAINKQVTESEERFRTMAESADILIAVSDAQMNTSYLNKAWQQLTGISVENLLRFGWVDLLHPEDKDPFLSRYLTAFNRREYFTGEFRMKSHTGDYRWLYVQCSPRFEADGAFAGYIASAIDITGRKQDEQRKSDFIGMVSHEMKTPLTSMNGFLQLLQMREGNEDPFTATMLGKAKKQVNKMTTLINGFLNVSRLESGQIHINKQRFDMAILVKESEEEAVSLYNTHRIVFAPVEETFVNADRDKIGQVISNLISNAVKYSPANTEIKVACVTENGVATVAVKDEGIGIKPEDQPRLFDRYYRVNNDNATSVSGFGIGLYLCAEIIQRHDGKIWVSSEVSKGSTFSFSLPVQM